MVADMNPHLPTRPWRGPGDERRGQAIADRLDGLFRILKVDEPGGVPHLRAHIEEAATGETVEVAIARGALTKRQERRLREAAGGGLLQLKINIWRHGERIARANLVAGALAPAG